MATTTTTNVNPYKVTTGVGRICFTKNLFVPDEKDSYAVLFLLPKSDTATVNAFKKSIEAFKTDPKAVAKWGSKFLASMKTGLRDGDTERDTETNPEYKGHYFINANTYTKPGVVDAQLQPVIDPAEAYSGRNARVTLVPGAFAMDGNKGIKWYLNNVQILAGGERLGGGASNASDDFTAVEATDDFLG